MQQANSDAAHAVLLDRDCDRIAQPVELELFRNGTIPFDTLAYFEAQLTRDNRRWKAQAEVKQVVAALHRDVQNITKSARHDHCGGRALALDDRIGDERGAMHDHRHIGRPNAGTTGEDVDARDDGLGRIGGCRERLVGDDLARVIVEEREIGERSADVDADAMEHLDVLHVTVLVDDALDDHDRSIDVARVDSAVSDEPQAPDIERQREQAVAREPIAKLRCGESVARHLGHDDVGARVERIHAQSGNRCEALRERCGEGMRCGDMRIVETGKRGRGGRSGWTDTAAKALADGHRLVDERP